MRLMDRQRTDGWTDRPMDRRPEDGRTDGKSVIEVGVPPKKNFNYQSKKNILTVQTNS